VSTANIPFDDLYGPFSPSLWERVLVRAGSTEHDIEENVETDKGIDFLYDGNGDDTLKGTTSVDPSDDDLRSRVLSLVLPPRWAKEGVPSPTTRSKRDGSKLVSTLYKQFSLIPTRVSATVEGGVFMSYDDHRTGNTLSIEVYNDLDRAAIVTNGKTPITAADIESDEHLSKIVLIFQKKKNPPMPKD